MLKDVEGSIGIFSEIYQKRFWRIGYLISEIDSYDLHCENLSTYDTDFSRYEKSLKSYYKMKTTDEHRVIQEEKLNCRQIDQCFKDNQWFLYK